MNFHAFLILLCIPLMLQGCIGATVVSTAAVATKVVIDPRTVGTQVDDSILEARVARTLFKDQQLKKKARIINTSYQGKVLLTGQAPTPELAKRAQQMTINVNGVTEVYNEIRYREVVSLRQTFIDAWITIKIRAQLLELGTLNSSKIKVITENSEVFLLGLVTNTEGKAAAEIASKVCGVKHVVTAFTFL